MPVQYHYMLSAHPEVCAVLYNHLHLMLIRHFRYCCDLCSDLRLLLYGRDVPVVTPGQFVVADREISLGDAVGSYEPLEKVVYGEVVVDSSA